MPALTGNNSDYKVEKGWVFTARGSRRARALLVRALLAGENLPRFVGSALLSAFLGVTLLFAIITGGHGESAFKMLTSTFGLAVANIDIASQDRTPLGYISEIDILEAIELDGDSAMLAFDIAKAHERILALPFVQSARLRKIYPNRLEITIKERRPMALWQHQGRLELIDGQGMPIAPYLGGSNADLPLLVGRGANEHAAQLLEVMEKFGNLKSRIRAYRRVADRRWDIVLDNGVLIKLPQSGFEARLAQMVALDETRDLLLRDIISVDLRLEDRISVALPEDAMARWRDEVKKQTRERG